MKALATWRRLSGRRRAVLIEAVRELGLARGLVALRPFRELAAAASRAPVAAGQAEADLMRREVSWAVTAAARRVPWRAKCLEQGLAAQAMLRRRGLASVLHYGVKSEAGGLRAHVWITIDGRNVVGGPMAVGYSEVARFPPEGAGLV